MNREPLQNPSKKQIYNKLWLLPDFVSLSVLHTQYCKVINIRRFTQLSKLLMLVFKIMDYSILFYLRVHVKSSIFCSVLFKFIYFRINWSFIYSMKRQNFLIVESIFIFDAADVSKQEIFLSNVVFLLFETSALLKNQFNNQTVLASHWHIKLIRSLITSAKNVNKAIKFFSGKINVGYIDFTVVGASSYYTYKN